jgi:hypothetical protein
MIGNKNDEDEEEHDIEMEEENSPPEFYENGDPSESDGNPLEAIEDDCTMRLVAHTKNVVFLCVSPSRRWLASGSEVGLKCKN